MMIAPPFWSSPAAPAGSTCYLRDTFTDPNGTVISAHAPDEAVGDFAWYGTAQISSNRINDPVSGATIQGYKSAYDALGVSIPFKITMVALCASAGYCGVTFENDDNTTKIILELGGAGALTVTVLDALDEVNDIATGLDLSVERTIEVIFEATRFQVILDGTPRTAVTFSNGIPIDMVAATPAIASTGSYISAISVCQTTDAIT